MIESEAALITYLETEFPRASAESWDFVGYNLKARQGNGRRGTLKILTCLDVNSAVINQALAEQISLIICFHPFKFGLNWAAIYKKEPHKSAWVQALRAARISVYAIHTNFDKHPQGTKYWLAQKLQWNQQILQHYDYAYLIAYSGQAQTLIAELKEKLQLNTVWTNLLAEEQITHLYLAPGAGNITAFLQNHPSPNAVLITSDLKWHEQQMLHDLGYRFIMIVHKSEDVFNWGITTFLQAKLAPQIIISNYYQRDFIKGY